MATLWIACLIGQIVFIKKSARKILIRQKYSGNEDRERAITHIFESKVALLYSFQIPHAKNNLREGIIETK